uniref:Uncharacterized protein n=1 Tax=viral metagenome TaxID=1070528 RepID=A0A6C0D016_9ZZZZ
MPRIPEPEQLNTSVPTNESFPDNQESGLMYQIKSIYYRYRGWFILLIILLILLILGYIGYKVYILYNPSKYAILISKDKDKDKYYMSKGNDKDGHFIKEKIQVQIIETNDPDIYLKLQYNEDKKNRKDSEENINTITFKKYKFIMKERGKEFNADVDYTYYDNAVIAILDNLSNNMDKFNIKIDSELFPDN